MLLKRRKASSFGPDGRRIGGSSLPVAASSSSTTPLSSSDDHANTTTTTTTTPTTTTMTTTTKRPLGNGLIRRRPLTSSISPSSITLGNSTTSNGLKKPVIGRVRSAVIRRAPIMSGLTVSGIGSAGLLKPFQRPKTGRRAYKAGEDDALKRASLGPKRTTGGMERLLSRAGKGLNFKTMGRKKDGDTDSSSDSEGEKEEERPFEPLCVWVSPHQEGGEAKGLPGTRVTEVRPDEFGVEEEVTVTKPAPLQRYSSHNVFVPPVLAKWLRPHQREGVKFMYDCVMGTKDYDGNGCILADDMGLGKTLQSVTLIYTLLKTGITSDKRPTAKRVIVVCPCSLVKNWDNEFVKWLGPGCVKTLALAEADRKKIEKDLDAFVKTSIFQILICSYECLRSHVGRLTKYPNCCDLLVCDEAHRLKNNENQTSRALASIPVKRRVLLTGTPMQNDLQEFYAMVDFTNPGILGTQEEFRRNMLFPILRGREPDATERQKQRMQEIQNEMSSIVNEFILRRINTLNAQHLPPKLVQVVCCNLTEIQRNMYEHLINSKAMQHLTDGKQVNCLGSIQMLMKLCNHPSLLADEDASRPAQEGKRRAAAKQIKYTDGDESNFQAPGADGVAKFLPQACGGGGGRGNTAPVFPQWSGKMFVLYRLMKEMRRPGNGGDKIVIISNYTQTLDLIGRMCRENSWGFCRLDGSINMKKRQKMVDEFNDPSSSLIAFLLSSKAGGCGLNLIGGNRLVLFDPDWNPAVDKQAAARCWRDGQRKRCFTYRFLATGTVEEKIFQRQLSKEGLQSVVDDKEQVNALSTKDLRNLFKLRSGTPSDTHDKLKCERCKIIHDNAEMEEKKVLPKKLAACLDLILIMVGLDDAKYFLAPLQPQDHDVTKEDYEKVVKQPMDLGTIQKRLGLPQDQAQAYKSVSGVSKDVNRIFANVVKVWSHTDEIFQASHRLQTWWTDEWPKLVEKLMDMKADEDASAADACKPCGEDEVDDSKVFQSHLNERSDDYQEQVGMPDEENMRSWSHHHRTDTVDDPIFRAAMRGCDAVSFVFGLEVTWSLIQQRQQEEEEAKAMQELNCLNELEDLEALEEDDTADDMAEGSREKKHAKEEEKVGGAEELSDSNDDGEKDEASSSNIVDDMAAEQAKLQNNDQEEPQVVGLIDWNEEEEGIEASEVEEDEDDAQLSEEEDDKDIEKAMQLEEEEDDDEGEDEDEEDNGNDSNDHDLSASGTKEEEVVDTPPAKGSRNGAGSLSGSSESPVGSSQESPSSVKSKRSRSSVTSSQSSAQSSEGGDSNEDSGDTWECVKCTYANAMKKSKCEMCQTGRPRAKRARQR